MAANPKVLRIVDAREVGPSTRELDVECIEGDAFSANPLGPLPGGAPPSIGGKYVIVHTGLVVDERAIKRAYSLIPVEGAPDRARLTIQRLGVGSSALHAAPIGTTLTFSGPWGKLTPEGGLPARTLLVATDTGITSALGIVDQSRVSSSKEVLWLRTADEDFLEVEHVRARIESRGARLVVVEIAEVGTRERLVTAWRSIDARVAETSPELVIATGDGAIVHPLRAVLPEKFRTVTDVRIECYFNNPEKKSV